MTKKEHQFAATRTVTTEHESLQVVGATATAQPVSQGGEAVPACGQ
jgi:hypothetical protein